MHKWSRCGVCCGYSASHTNLRPTNSIFRNGRLFAEIHLLWVILRERVPVFALFSVSSEILLFFTFYNFQLTFHSQGARNPLQLVQNPCRCSVLSRKQESLCVAAQVGLFLEIPSSATPIFAICLFALAVFVQNQRKRSSRSSACLPMLWARLSLDDVSWMAKQPPIPPFVSPPLCPACSEKEHSAPAPTSRSLSNFKCSSTMSFDPVPCKHRIPLRCSVFVRHLRLQQRCHCNFLSPQHCCRFCFANVF